MSDQVLRFGSSGENLALAEKLIDDVCRKYNVNEDHYGNILIAVTEAVNNAIYHGNLQELNKNVTIEFSAPSKTELVFKVKDEGSGFDFNSLPDPTDPENIEKISGRGVFLMRSLSDRVEFSDNGASVELAFSLN